MDLNFDENMSCTSSTSTTFDLQEIAKVFPNPNNGFFNIEINDNSISKWEASLFSTNGKLVFQDKFEGSKTTIQMNDMADGIFILKVTTRNGIYTSKIVKN